MEATEVVSRFLDSVKVISILKLVARSNVSVQMAFYLRIEVEDLIRRSREWSTSESPRRLRDIERIILIKRPPVATDSSSLVGDSLETTGL